MRLPEGTKEEVDPTCDKVQQYFLFLIVSPNYLTKKERIKRRRRPSDGRHQSQTAACQ